jgi:hypothetical protein
LNRIAPVTTHLQNIMATQLSTKHVETLRHPEDRRRNIPSAEQKPFVHQEQKNPQQIR